MSWNRRLRSYISYVKNVSLVKMCIFDVGRGSESFVARSLNGTGRHRNAISSPKGTLRRHGWWKLGALRVLLLF